MKGEKVIEKTGRTVEEAIEQITAEFGVDKEQIAFEILEAPSKGLFGFGSKPARVRASFTESDDPLEAAQEFLREIFTVLKLKVDQEASSETEPGDRGKNYSVINLRGNDLGMLIGKHGQTLDALQYLTNIVANKASQERIRLVLDVEGYRKRREETLIRLARRLADKVRQSRERVVLEPMNPQERKIIHMALQNDYKITTYSEGDEPFRRVVIALRR